MLAVPRPADDDAAGPRMNGALIIMDERGEPGEGVLGLDGGSSLAWVSSVCVE